MIEFGQQGASIVEMACEIGVTRQTLYEWRDRHSEFSDALTRATEESQRWWEKKGRDNLATAGFQSSVWSRSMAARFPRDWREKSEVDHGLTDDMAKLLERIDGRTREVVPPKRYPE